MVETYGAIFINRIAQTPGIVVIEPLGVFFAGVKPVLKDIYLIGDGEFIGRLVIKRYKSSYFPCPIAQASHAMKILVDIPKLKREISLS
jgi:hypothetical protein